MNGLALGMMGDPVQSLSKTVHPEVAGPKLQQNQTEPRFGGGPLALEAELVTLSEGGFTGDGPMIDGLNGSFGPSAVLRVGGIEILVVTIARQILDLQQFRAFGIEPEKKSVVALQSMQHFRAAFEPIAGRVIMCDCGALCTPRYDRLPYRNVPRPIFPLDRDMTLSSGSAK